MKLIQRLRYAYECGQEKADLLYKIRFYQPRFCSLLDDPAFEQICSNLTENEEKERQYGFLERRAFDRGYRKTRKK